MADSIINVASRGDNIISARNLYGGTYTQFNDILPKFGIEVRFVTIPVHSSGFVPYSRVVHAKYMLVDGERAWLGTSNWSRGYFEESRNVGILFEGRAFAERLERYFAKGWNSEYAETLDPEREYEVPRIGE